MPRIGLNKMRIKKFELSNPFRQDRSNQGYEVFSEVLDFMRSALQSGLPMAAIFEMVKRSPPLTQKFTHVGLANLLFLEIPKTDGNRDSRGGQMFAACAPLGSPLYADFVQCLGDTMRWGGNCLPVIDAFCQAVKDRQKFRSDFELATAQVKFQTKILAFSPLILIVFFALFSVDRILVFFSSKEGCLVFGFMCFLYLLGFFWVKKISELPRGV